VSARALRRTILASIGSLFSALSEGQTATEFPITTAGADPFAIVAGSDGNLWFTEFQKNQIGRITPAGVVTEFPLPNANSHPNGITAGPDGNLWFTELTIPGRIGRISTSGTITEFLTTTSGAQPGGICAGPDGNLWFQEPGASKIGRITTAGVVTEFPTTGGGYGIAAGSDGALWFVENGANKIGRITTAGVVTNDFPIPTANSMPRGIAAGPDGNLWFTETAVAIDQIGRITTAGVITEFPTPTFRSPSFIAAGPDGNLWFTEPHATASQIGRITTAGVITEFPTASGTDQAAVICAGPDGAMWFTEPGNNKIGRITTGAPVAAQFYSVAPCRVVDTRNANGPYGGPALVANVNRTFVFSGQCGIPVGAKAVVLNVATTGPTAGGDLRLFPGGSSLPLTSAINYNAGKTRANDAIIRLGAGGDLVVHVDQPSGTVHAILDVTGYFQ
jgi:streptogramin lyase